MNRYYQVSFENDVYTTTTTFTLKDAERVAVQANTDVYLHEEGLYVGKVTKEGYVVWE